MWPVSIMRLASSRWPVSNTSSSGVTPASRMSVAIASRIGGVFTNTFAPHVHAAHVERADFRAQIEHVLHALARRAQRGAGAGLHRIGRRRARSARRAGGQVDDDVGAALADAVHHLGVERALHAGQRRSSGRAHGCARSRRRPWRHRSPRPRSAPASPARPGSSRAMSADPVTAQEIITLRCTAVLPFCCSLRQPTAPRGSRDTGSRCMRASRTLPPIVRCAKPRKPVPGTNPN